MNVDELLERTFERHAADAPGADKLLARVDARVRRRRRLGVLSSAAAALAVAAVLFTVIQLPAPLPPANGPLPAGWRWESYKGIEVQVPSAWRNANFVQKPCMRVQDKRPFVGRQGGVMTLEYQLCGRQIPLPRDRVTSLWVDAGHVAGTKRYDQGWVEETKVVGGIPLAVFTDDAGLRRRILATARVVKNEDANGCPLGHRLRTAGDTLGGRGIDALGTVSSISVCTYYYDTSVVTSKGIKASSRFNGAEADAIVAAIRAAPKGIGPDATERCDHALGEGEATLLLARSGTDTVPVVVRYDSCRGHGIFDGAVNRMVTGELLDLVLTGAHHPGGHHISMGGLMPSGSK